MHNLLFEQQDEDLSLSYGALTTIKSDIFKANDLIIIEIVIY
jgi:hypothetical protein